MPKHWLSVPLGALLAVCLALGGCAPTAGPSPASGPARPAAEKPAAQPAATSAADAAGADRGPAGARTDEGDVASFYRGKTIRLIVGHDAGGGFDVYSRLIARYLGKHIPGNPNVIVENMPGAGGLVAANHVYNVAPKDGTVIANIIGGINRSQLFGQSSVQFDGARFRYLGAPNRENPVLAVSKASGITKLEDILGPNARQVTLGDPGAATTNHNASVLTRDVLGANIKVVSGYGTTAKVELAMEQGEVDGQYNDWASIKARQLAKVQSGEWLLLGQLTDAPLPELPNAPMILSFARDDEQRQMLRYGIVVPSQFTRPYFLPPGVPAERAAALEAAFAQTLADQDFLTEAARAQLDIAPMTGAEIQRLITDYLALPAELKAQLEKVIPQS